MYLPVCPSVVRPFHRRCSNKSSTHAGADCSKANGTLSFADEVIGRSSPVQHINEMDWMVVQMNSSQCPGGVTVDAARTWDKRCSAGFSSVVFEDLDGDQQNDLLVGAVAYSPACSANPLTGACEFMLHHFRRFMSTCASVVSVVSRVHSTILCLNAAQGERNCL